MSHTRTRYLNAKGFTPEVFVKLNRGLILFNERVFYFKEFLPIDAVFVSMELSGVSEDGVYYEFEYRFYDCDGKNRTFGKVQGGWLDLRHRRLAAPPENLMEAIKNIPKSVAFKLLKTADFRDRTAVPQHRIKAFA